jgi:hypothetical protein
VEVTVFLRYSSPHPFTKDILQKNSKLKSYLKEDITDEGNIKIKGKSQA